MQKSLNIEPVKNLQNSTLRNRAERANGGRSQEFVALVNGVEAALLSYEDWSDQSVGFIYEIFVLQEFRKQGIGASLLSYAEDLARKFNCTYIRLEPYTLDQETDLGRLVAWWLGIPKMVIFRSLTIQKKWKKI